MTSAEKSRASVGVSLALSRFIKEVCDRGVSQELRIEKSEEYGQAGAHENFCFLNVLLMFVILNTGGIALPDSVHEGARLQK